MLNLKFARRRIRGAAGWWLCSILAGAWAWLPSPAGATCLISTDPLIRELQTLVDTDAARALMQVRMQLDAVEKASRPDTQRLAALYSVQAQAYSILELDDEARNAATRGLTLAGVAGDPVRLDLLSAYAENIYDPVGLAAAVKSVDGARAALTPGSLADTCCSSPADCCNTGRTASIWRSAA